MYIGDPTVLRLISPNTRCGCTARAQCCFLTSGTCVLKATCGTRPCKARLRTITKKRCGKCALRTRAVCVKIVHTAIMPDSVCCENVNVPRVEGNFLQLRCRCPSNRPMHCKHVEHALKDIARQVRRVRTAYLAIRLDGRNVRTYLGRCQTLDRHARNHCSDGQHARV